MSGNEQLELEIKKASSDGRAACPVLLDIAARLKVSPRDVGEACNRLEIKIKGCQLGCFK